jgi:hypothetical protein
VLNAPGSQKETRRPTFQEKLLEAFATSVFNDNGQLGPLKGKPGSGSSEGDGCECQTIKNYPPFTRKPKQRITATGKIPIGRESLRDSSFIIQDDGNERSIVLDGI